MKIQDLDIKSIKAYSKNPRKNDAAVDAVAASIREFGWKQPLVIDPTTMEIVAGHTRYKAAKKLCCKTVPCVMADDLTAEQIKAYRLADNKTAELAEWDFSVLENELAELSEMDIDFDMQDFGFDFSETEEPQEIVEDDVPEVDEEGEPTVQVGDIWQLGRHRLMCGDSTDKTTVEKLMNGEKADLLVTDPPYNVAYEGKTQDKLTILNDSMKDGEFHEFLRTAFENADSVMREGGAFYIWHADSEGFNFRSACKQIGWRIRQCLIWVKNAIVLGWQDYQWKHEPCLYGWKDGAAHYFVDDRTQSTVWEVNKPLRNGEHPTTKPVELIAKAVNNSSRRGDNVLDLFGGSGTTLIASEQTGRKCYMMELDPKYCDVIIKRWETLTGQKAAKIERQNYD